MQNDKARLLELLVKFAYKKGEVKLSSGKISNFYVDCRVVTLSAEGAYLCGKIIFDLIKNENISAIGGPTIGADPLVGAIATVSFENNKPINTFIVRKTAKAHGMAKQIEGPSIPNGSKVILIDDVATSGGSLIEAIGVLDKENIEVEKAIVVIDRQEGAKEALAQKNCQLISLFTRADFK
ncbi:MAG: orotate phosphoribosyltransferase [Candidatus Omnitrophota bacterium]